MVIFSNHNSLTFCIHCIQRLMRWVLFLQPYNLNIRHNKGVDNVIAHALSRTSLSGAD